MSQVTLKNLFGQVLRFLAAIIVPWLLSEHFIVVIKDSLVNTELAGPLLAGYYSLFLLAGFFVTVIIARFIVGKLSHESVTFGRVLIAGVIALAILYSWHAYLEPRYSAYKEEKINQAYKSFKLDNYSYNQAVVNNAVALADKSKCREAKGKYVDIWQSICEAAFKPPVASKCTGNKESCAIEATLSPLELNCIKGDKTSERLGMGDYELRTLCFRSVAWLNDFDCHKLTYDMAETSACNARVLKRIVANTNNIDLCPLINPVIKGDGGACFAASTNFAWCNSEEFTRVNSNGFTISKKDCIYLNMRRFKNLQSCLNDTGNEECYPAYVTATGDTSVCNNLTGQTQIQCIQARQNSKSFFETSGVVPPEFMAKDLPLTKKGGIGSMNGWSIDPAQYN